MLAMSLLHLTLVDVGQFRFKLGNPTILKLYLSVCQSQLMIFGVKFAHQP
jgi:hypothetical protein